MGMTKLMKQNTIKRVLFILIVLSGSLFSRTNAQDVQFSQFYAVTPFINPAFAGGAGALRAMIHGRYQWPGLDARYVTGLVSVDNYFHKYNSGLGGYILQDQQGLSDMVSTNVNLLYSYELTLTKQVSVRAGLQGGYNSTSINYEHLYYPSQIDQTTGQTPTQGIGLPSSRKQYFDVGSGLLVYSSRLWGGVSAHHMNQPSNSFYDDPNAVLPVLWDVIGGVKIPIRSGGHMAYLHEEDNIFLTPTAHYKAQGKSDQMDIGLYLTYNQFMIGAWYRGLPLKQYQSLPNSESMVFNIGWLYNDWSFGYSYDLTVSKLARSGTGGAHEINITYTHHKSNKHKTMKRLPCPDFYRPNKHQ